MPGYPPVFGYEPAGAYPPATGYPAPGWTPYAAPASSLVPAGLKYGGAMPRFLAWWLDGLIVGIVMAVIAGIITSVVRDSAGSGLIAAALFVGADLLYFLALWTSSGRATLGMRLFHLQVGNAADGATLTMGQAFLRWVLLGMPLQALSLLPWGLAGLATLAPLWYLLLLITTVASPTRQGLHDRIAGTAMVAPIGREGPVMACLAIAVIFFVAIPIVAFVAFISLGTAIQSVTP